MTGSVAHYRGSKIMVRVVGDEHLITSHPSATDEDKQKAKDILTAIKNLMELL
jgi:hypothetical protein